MRIRRRPSLFPAPSASPSPSPPTPPDPPNPLQSLQDAATTPSRGGDDRLTSSQEKPRLHQDVDLHKNPHLLPDQPPHTITCCIAIHSQVERDEEEAAAAMEVLQVVDSSKGAQVNSKKRESNGSGEEEEVNAQRDDCNATSCTTGAGGATAAMAREKRAASESGGRKRRSPPVLMEGSRCSRVNGRGWRCSQQTLVGYALCEHHLGKGRLRSGGAARGQLGATAKRKALASAAAAREPASEEKASVAAALRRRRRVGAAKARSMSSLLDAAEHAPATVSPRLPQLEAALLGSGSTGMA